MGLLSKVKHTIGARLGFKALNLPAYNQPDMELLGSIASMQVKQNRKSFTSLHDAEFKVYSQWGEDGIIQYLVNEVEISNKYFIEFGVESYIESNTRFLLKNNNWSGLIMDGSAAYMQQVQQSEDYWKYDLTAKTAFITKENINQLISESCPYKEIGILSVDIDGNDYWVWEQINVITADIVIAEYNSVFGIDRAITTPYKADFQRTNAHYSNLYFGASLLALCDLADKKGYFFVGCNTAGNNAFFVKKDKIGSLLPLKPEEGYVFSRFREARDKEGKLTYATNQDRLKVLKGLPVYNTRTGQTEYL